MFKLIYIQQEKYKLIHHYAMSNIFQVQLKLSQFIPCLKINPERLYDTYIHLLIIYG